ncbi:hypothetical protein BaRGS_00006217 [Batillaria attramentaria]|uniref:Secreted protein n=1 Tax=Batillaria attramentaria TaxID=370345 RepID=A0ABD0LTM8_9CAEN
MPETREEEDALLVSVAYVFLLRLLFFAAKRRRGRTHAVSYQNGNCVCPNKKANSLVNTYVARKEEKTVKHQGQGIHGTTTVLVPDVC